ncbi:MAG: hypothetical protein NZV14_06455 [Bryobacteraceae bacterium]|nr:hypothetical protein [Bryobacteraceae bacterium]MDW8377784.1 hypothetical protein [Bryobacterales bacterium]
MPSLAQRGGVQRYLRPVGDVFEFLVVHHLSGGAPHLPPAWLRKARVHDDPVARHAHVLGSRL